jgi:hypothetical protein
MARAYLYGNPRSLGLRWYGQDIRWIEPFSYIHWDEDEIVSRIKSELGWRAPESLQSTWRFDCRVHHLVDFMYLGTLGMTDSDDFYAKMVRERAITREEALVRVARANTVHMDEIAILLQQAGFTDLRFLERLNLADGESA